MATATTTTTERLAMGRVVPGTFLDRLLALGFVTGRRWERLGNVERNPVLR